VNVVLFRKWQIGEECGLYIFGLVYSLYLIVRAMNNSKWIILAASPACVSGENYKNEI